MGTLKTAIDDARELVDDGKRKFSDERLVARVNSVISNIHNILIKLKSNLVFTTETVTTSTIVNGEFESWTSDAPDNWTASAYAVVAQEETLAYSGSSLKITATGGANQYEQSDDVTVNAATDYTLKLRYFNTAGDTAQYMIYDVTNDADIVAITDLASSTTWSAEQEISFTTPAGCTSIYFQLLAKTDGDIVYFDNVYLNSTTDGNGAYTLDTDFYSPLPHGSWMDGIAGYLPQIEESERWTRYSFDDTTTGPPECFFVTSSGNIGYRPIPDIEYTIYHPIATKPTALTTYATDTLPYDGIFNQYIMWQVKADILNMLERDNSGPSKQAELAMDRALDLVYARGIRNDEVISDMFDYYGV